MRLASNTMIESFFGMGGSKVFSKGPLNGVKANTIGAFKEARQLDREATILRNKDHKTLANLAENARQRSASIQEYLSKTNQTPTEAQMKQMERLTSEANKYQRYIGLNDDEMLREADILEGKARASYMQAREGIKDTPKAIKNWMLAKDFSGDPEQFKVAAGRIGVVGGAYAGLAIGGRYISGGGVTYNNQGQRDIAGIPFV